jgi:hypothetical protein
MTCVSQIHSDTSVGTDNYIGLLIRLFVIYLMAELKAVGLLSNKVTKLTSRMTNYCCVDFEIRIADPLAYARYDLTIIIEPTPFRFWVWKAGECMLQKPVVILIVLKAKAAQERERESTRLRYRLIDSQNNPV